MGRKFVGFRCVIALLVGVAWGVSATRARADSPESAPAPALESAPAPAPALESAPAPAPALESASAPALPPPPDVALSYDELHRPAVAHPLRALAEEVVFLGVGTGWYWAARKQNLFDWDRPSLKQRFEFEAIRFDNNKFPINFIWHPLSGASYYAAARTNGLSLLASSAVALGACVLWEYGIEFREKVSINDLIFTPLPSISLGEFYSRLALYLNRSPGKFGPVRKAVAYTVGVMQTAHDAADGVSRSVKGEADRLGYSAATYHRFDVRVGYGAQTVGTRSGVLSDLRMDAELIAIPRYGAVGRFSRVLRDGDFSRFSLHTAEGPSGQEVELLNDLSLFGYFRQYIDDTLHGAAFFVGTSLGYRYRKLRFEGFSDDLALTRLPGLAVDALLRSGETVFRARVRVHPEFAGVHAAAYGAYHAARPDVLPKSTLDRDGYLYAFGVSSDLNLDLELTPYAAFGGRFSFVYLNSVEGLDRHQELLTADPRGVERALDAEAYVRAYPLGRARFLVVELALLTRRRQSQLGGFHADSALSRSSLRVGADF